MEQDRDARGITAEQDRDARGISARRQELLQSGLSLCMNSSTVDNRRKEESSNPVDSTFSSGNKGRVVADARLVPFGLDKGDGAVGEKPSRREASGMFGLGDRRTSNSAVQYNSRVDALQAASQMELQSDSLGTTFQISSTQNQSLFSKGLLSGRIPAPFSLVSDRRSEEANPTLHDSPTSSPRRLILDHCSQGGPQHTLKSGQRSRTPNLRDGKSTVGGQQQSLQRHIVHQQGFDPRDGKGLMCPGSPQQLVLHQESIAVHHQVVEQQQARPQQVLDARERKGMRSGGTPQQQGLQDQAKHQQVLDAGESKGMIPAMRPHLPALQLQSIQQPSVQVLHPETLDASKGMVPSATTKKQVVQQHSTTHHQTLQQVFNLRESKCSFSSEGPQHQQRIPLEEGIYKQRQSLKQQVPQKQGLLQQVLDPRDSKGTTLAGNSQQHALHKQLLQKQVMNAREIKHGMHVRASQQQAIRRQILHQQVVDTKDCKGVILSGSSQQQDLQCHALHQQIVDLQDGKSGISVGGQQERQVLHVQVLQQQSLQQQAMQHRAHPQQLLDCGESNSTMLTAIYQRQALQSLHQQALQQVGPHHTSVQTLHLPSVYKGYQNSQCQSTEQHCSSQHLSTVNLGLVYTNKSHLKVEPAELERAALADRSSADKDSLEGKQSTADSAPLKESVSVAESSEGVVDLVLKRMKTEESKPSLSLSSAAESKDSVRSGGHPEGDKESLHPQSQSSGRISRENMFADLNAEPPASDGEDEYSLLSNGVQMVAQPESSSRTTTEEKKQRKKVAPDFRGRKDADEADIRKAAKAAKPRAKSKGDGTVESGLEGDGHNHSNGILTAKEEKIKGLQLGLINVARKLPRNAHAHFTLGLMHQRSGQNVKAAQSFRQAADILKQPEEGISQLRGRFLAIVQVHQAQCLLEGSLQGQLLKLGPSKELLKEELQNMICELKEATLIETGQASVWSTLGFLLLQSGRIQSAIYVLMSLLEIVPDHVDTLTNLGVAYLHSGQFAHATRCFQWVLEKDKNHPGALINYAALLLHQHGAGAGAGAGPGAYGPRLAAALAAQQCLEAALKQDPKAGYIWADLAAAYSTLGNIPRASECLEKVAKLEPARLSTLYAIAAHRVRDAERSEDANEQLGWAACEMASILRDGNFTTLQPKLAWAGLAMVNRAQHETAAAFDGGGVDLKEVEERALHTLQQAIEEDPEDAVQWHQMGLHTLCTLHFGAAQNYFKIAIARRRINPSAWSNLGIALQLSEDPALAEGVYKQALALAPKEQAHTVLSNLGNLYRQQRKFSEAHEMYNQALGLCPDYAPACNNLGLLLVTEGKWDDAILAFDRALNADPYLDAAKSNRMKAVALSQMRRGDGFDTSPTGRYPLESAVVKSDPSTLHVAVEDASIAVSSLLAHCPPSSELTKTEPFPLPSVS